MIGYIYHSFQVCYYKQTFICDMFLERVFLPGLAMTEQNLIGLWPRAYCNYKADVVTLSLYIDQNEPIKGREANAA